MTPHGQVHYEVQVEGRLDVCWQPFFEHLRLVYRGSDTTLVGPIADQAALHGVLDRIRDLGLTLISVRQVEPPPPESDRET
jgi:hypothetical protein